MLSIPPGHNTTTGSLFMLPQITSLVGKYPENFFFLVENNKPPIQPLAVISPYKEVLQKLDLHSPATYPTSGRVFNALPFAIPTSRTAQLC